jgi:Leucine-rich repeat (LRR) protein
MTKISIDRSGFFKLDNGTFSNLTSITTLSVTNNKVRHIPVNSFTGNVRMTLLNFSGDKIVLIDDDAFDGLKNLLELKLASNQKPQLSATIFANLTSLQTFLAAQ